ncbi:MAG TPA: RNA methyltransferase, partial [Myxococcales bacterium]|nr:RNA methyltransferase [Myxococcales bacterium]
VLLSGWDGCVPLHDPVCGSGTLAIEAALFAAARAPNERRTLACEKWPRTAASDRETLRRLRSELRQRAERRAAAGLLPVLASDRDADAVAATAANARAAQVEVQTFAADAREVKSLEPPGQFLLNVPYGERLRSGGRKQLKTFYYQLGAAMRRLEKHRAAILSASEDFESAFGIRPTARHRLWNGPLRSTLHLYEL